jgi:hypothetical protein
MISVLAFVVGVSTSAPAFDPIAPDGPEGFKAVVEPFLKKHCYDCHGDDSVEGDLNLTALPLQTTTATQAAGWLRMLDQLQADLMPPREELRPNSAKRARVIYWIEKTVLDSGHVESYRRKMLLPAYGNYVDHDLLFSGKINAKAYSSARLWRTGPHIFSGMRGIGRVKGLQNPFTYSAPVSWRQSR